MTCKVCDNEIRPTSTPEQHSREAAPYYHPCCLGCFQAITELRLFIIRATCNDDGSGGRNVMGAWAEGWLREIIKDPTRYR